MGKKDKYNIEISDRYCPICAKFIKKGSPFHHCNDEDLNKIYHNDLMKERSEEESYLYDNLTFSDLLDEAEFLTKPYLYEDLEEEEDI